MVILMGSMLPLSVWQMLQANVIATSFIELITKKICITRITQISRFIQSLPKFSDALSTSASPDGFMTLKGFRKCVIWRGSLKLSQRARGRRSGSRDMEVLTLTSRRTGSHLLPTVDVHFPTQLLAYWGYKHTSTFFFNSSLFFFSSHKNWS